MHRGYVKLWRKSTDSKIFSDGLSAFGFWCWLLVKANHKEGWFCGVKVEPGQIATSYGSIADSTGASVKQCRNWLEKLVENNMIKKENWANRFTIITICNWPTYQYKDVTTGQTEGTTEGTTEGKPRANQGQQSKNGKNEENEKNNTWRENFALYLELVEKAKEDLLKDNKEIAKQEGYYHNVDIKMSIEKSVSNYWGTDEGWKNKKSKRSEPNMKRTLINAIEKSRVFYPKQNSFQPSEQMRPSYHQPYVQPTHYKGAEE